MCEAQCQEDRGGEEREKAAHGLKTYEEGSHVLTPFAPVRFRVQS
jgi:hypothetical protein